MSVARAIDVGYGNTKFTLNDGMGVGESIRCGMFPSVAPAADSVELDSAMERKDRVIITVSGNQYVVGPDAMLAMGSNASRQLHLDFASGDTYIALARGAMHYMGVERIDQLVVGLPVSSLSAMAGPVQKAMQGPHDIAGRTVFVDQVKVVAQPVGGMIDFGVRHQIIDKMQHGNNLLIDPGYYTLDWVLANGMKPVGVRSDAANNVGMAAILRSIADRLSARVKEREGRPVEMSEGVLQRIDDALRSGTNELRFNGKPVRLDDCMGGMRTIIADGLNRMRSKLGTLADIDRVILVGGASHVYEPAVSEMFKGYDVRVAMDSVFANVRGFQIIANKSAMPDKNRRVAKAA